MKNTTIRRSRSRIPVPAAITSDLGAVNASRDAARSVSDEARGSARKRNGD